MQARLNHWGEDPYWNTVGNAYGLVHPDPCNCEGLKHRPPILLNPPPSYAEWTMDQHEATQTQRNFFFFLIFARGCCCCSWAPFSWAPASRTLWISGHVAAEVDESLCNIFFFFSVAQRPPRTDGSKMWTSWAGASTEQQPAISLGTKFVTERGSWRTQRQFSQRENWCVTYLLHLECGFDDVICFSMTSKCYKFWRVGQSFIHVHAPTRDCHESKMSKMLWSVLRPMKHLCFLSLHDRGKTYTYRKWPSAQKKLQRLFVLQRFQWSKDGIDQAVKIFAPHQLTKNN